MGCDQLGGVLGVDEPGGVSAGHLIEPGAVYVVDRPPCLLDGEVRVVGSDNEDRGCRDRSEFGGCQDKPERRRVQPPSTPRPKRCRPCCAPFPASDQGLARPPS